MNGLWIDRARLPGRRIANGVLSALLLVLLVGACSFDRSAWPSLIGDEATYLMAAESLAWDLDLRFERRDYDRFLEHWQQVPEGLILQSGDGGETLTYGKPFFYPLWVAPFVRFAPIRGSFVANVFALAIAALLATRALRPTVGELAPLWVACSLFASVAFAYTFWAHADLFLLALTASALSLAFWKQGEGTARTLGRPSRPALRWFVVGVLLATVVFSRPLYLPLFLPVLFALPHQAKVRAGAALGLGALALVSGSVLVHRLNGEAWTSYGAQRRGFYASTGFPVVDFPARQWQESLEDLGDASWAEARMLRTLPPTSPSLWWWNSIYFVVGRFIGVLPYFLPLVLGLWGRPRGLARWMLLAAVAFSVAGFFLYRPFNIYGGGGAIANRYFMPLYPAFWFLASRPCRARRIIAVVLLAAPFLWPLWQDPDGFPKRSNHTFRYVSNFAVRLLPFETTQSHLKPAGRSAVVHGGLWVKFLTPTLREKRDRTALLLNRGSRGQILVGSSRPLRSLDLHTLGDPTERLEVVRGATTLDETANERGRKMRLELQGPRARHPMWWTWDPFFLYQLDLRSPVEGEGRITFILGVARAEPGGSS